jgi:TonB family protein
MRIAEFSGRAVEGFPLLQLLGCGEQSAVYLTEHETRRAAIKLVSVEPGMADAQLAEWRAAAELKHPNLIQIFRVGRGEMDGVAFLYAVMDYAEENLSEVVPERTLTPDEARDMLVPALSALAFLHEQGFAHGRVKLSNIMAVNDTLKLSSDGIRKSEKTSGDVQALGMALVQALPDLQPPFSEIVRGCLEQNWTVQEIADRLKPSGRSMPMGLLILAALVILLVAGVVIWRGRESTTALVFAPVSTPVSALVSAPTPSAPVQEAAKPVVAAPAAPVTTAVHQPMPEILPEAMRSVHGRLVISVIAEVDPSGAVTDARLESGPSKYFSARTLDAVRQWKFEPVKVDGREVNQRWRLRFEFLANGAKVSPTRMAP